jgi:hypothetical protein
MNKNTYICSGCGIEIQRWPSQVLPDTFIFCSRTCRNTNYKKANPDWHPSNYKTYKRTCTQCKTEYSVTGTNKNTKKLFCSKDCANEAQRNKVGKPHTTATKEKLAQKQKEYCANHSNQFVSGSSKGQHKMETISKLSEKNCNKPPRWKGRVFIYEGPQGTIRMRSSYELFYAHWLDSKKICWEYEPRFKLSNGKMFCPDFKLKTGVIIEIKGYWAETGKVKWQLFCQDYPDIPKQVLMKMDLNKLGMGGAQYGN